jgi:hypothetical protein
MVSVRFGRHATAITTAAGFAWVSLSMLSLLSPEPARYLDVLFVVPYTLSLAGILGLHALQRRHAGRLERTGAWVSVVGMAVTLVGQVGIITDLEVLKRTALPTGVAIWLLGFALFGVATARARVLPPWAGAAIALSQPLAVVAGLALSPISPLSSTGDYSGALAHGLVWLALSAALRAHREAAARGLALNTG